MRLKCCFQVKIVLKYLLVTNFGITQTKNAKANYVDIKGILVGTTNHNEILAVLSRQRLATISILAILPSAATEDSTFEI